MRKLVACLACRNQGSRLYGKPMQNLCIKKSVKIIDYIIKSLKGYRSVSEIVLGISEGTDNLVFQNIAKQYDLKYVIGDEDDVLSRLIDCCELASGSDIFRLTTESPFTYFEAVDRAWLQHKKEDNDITALDHLPDGAGFEIIKLEAYQYSWKHGRSKHRSELCSLYIRENKEKFKISYVDIPNQLRRTDVRLTVDYPEDLILCRAIYNEFEHLVPYIPLANIIEFIDTNPNLKELVSPYVDEGLKTMYL